MKCDDELQLQLDELGRRLGREASVVDRVMRRIDQMPEARSPRSHHLRRLIMKSSLGIAACAVVGMVAWLVFSIAATETLYAQVNKAIEEARTIHIVVKRLQEGQWVKHGEVFYERGVGVAEYSYRDGRTSYFRIDNGRNAWMKGRHGYIVRSTSSDPMGIVKKMFRQTTDILQGKRNATRDPNGDTIVDGVPCKLYVRTEPAMSGWKMRVWIDEKGFMRRYEKRHKRDGKWETYSIFEARYDIPIDRSLFALEDVPEIKVIDRDKLFETKFSLEKALFKKETMGLICAVHELKRVEGDMIYLVTSIRPTAATIMEFGRIDPIAGGGCSTYGDFMIGTGWKRVDGGERSYQPVTIAQINNDGLSAQWTLLQRKGSWPEEVKDFELSASVYTRWELQERLKAEGKEWWQRFRPMTTLPLPEKETPLAIVVYRTYADAASLEPVVFSVRLSGSPREGSEPETTMVPMYRPREISEVGYAESVERLLQWHEDRAKSAGEAATD